MKKPSGILLRVLVAVVCIIGIAVAFAWFDHVSSRPGIRGLDPGEMGKMESAMWRSYYEGKWVRLGWQTLDAAHRQHGFSWIDSLRMAAHAARAALYFRKNSDDPRCLPELEAYYQIIRRAMRGTFDVSQAARLELEWWKERRRSIAPQEYARTIAKLTAMVYGVSEESVLPACILRAEAMAYRDARRDGKMADEDWAEISRRLETAYSKLKTATVDPARE